jgi:deoxyribodipyrimidine photo-lyase
MSRFGKREYAAYSLRPKLAKLLPGYLEPVKEARMRRRFAGLPPASRIPTAAECDIDHSVRPSVAFRGGRSEAERALAEFLENRLWRYARQKNEPAAHATSDLSPYLHFGQISSLEIALTVKAHAAEHKLMADEFLEELIVRRELAFNFARHTEDPRSLSALPAWARESLAKHDGDPRPAVYSRDEFVNARTHDALWNATQKEMLLRGKIHGYYRMYWGKKIIEWSPSHAAALDTMLYIHDRYALDGRDPNTYTNVLWCFGLHDRPWQERPVFGMIRYMSLEGMRRKTGVDAYIREIEGLE